MSRFIKHIIKANQSPKWAVVLFGLMAAFTAPQSLAANAPTMPSVDSLEVSLPDLTGAFLPHSAAAPRQTALDFVRKTGISRNLSLMLLHDVKGRAAVQAAVKRYGMDTVQNTVVKVILSAQSQYGTEWEQMLAGIYQAHFGAQALRSLTVERDASPYFVRLLDVQDDIAQAVKEKGQAILQKARTDILAQIEATLPV